MENLNPQQRLAVQTTEGPVLIVAGPGTGKTKTLTARIVHLLSLGVKPADILALTFTKKAAQEMRQRVQQQTKAAPVILTFHALCSRLLGGGQTFISEPERLAIIKSVPKPVALKSFSARELGLRISRAKNLADDDPAVATLVTAYDAQLRTRNLIDFDDLLIKTRDTLLHNPAARPTYRYILVDEFQDTNRLQYELLHLLKSSRNIFVIGDPNQSIYGFRGASGTIFEQFKTDFAGATDITLNINYRSAPEVVALSNTIFADEPALRAHSTTPGHVRAVQVLNQYSEAAWVLGEIQRAIGGADLLQAAATDDRRSLRDFAILYRSRAAAMAMQTYIAQSGLPYQIVGDGSPYDVPDVQKIIGLLRCFAGHEAHVTGFTPGQVSVLLQKVDAAARPANIAVQLMEVCALQPTRDTAQFVGTLVRFKTLADVVAHLDAIADQQFYDPQAEVITLLTIHAAKGLEFAHVFLIGTEEGILPHAKADEPEERRLFYVAATRAKETLDITYATKRGGQPAVPSRFITNISDTILPKQRDPHMAGDQRRATKRQAKRAQTRLF